MLAAASDAIVIGFNVRPNPKAHLLASQERVDVRYYDVIYKLTSDLKDAMAGLLSPTYHEIVSGHAEVRQVFSISKVGTVAGSYVIDGKLERGVKIRLIRDSVVAYDGRIASLRRFKEDVKEVLEGYECGILLENYNDVKVGDTLEAYTLEEVKPALE
jgi:translation initiation factor IF-2